MTPSDSPVDLDYLELLFLERGFNHHANKAFLRALDVYALGLIKRARERDELRKELHQTRPNLAREANYQANKHCDRAELNYEKYEQEFNRATKAERERDELRDIVAEVADGVTEGSVYGESSTTLRSECSDCGQVGQHIYGKIEHDETCIVSRARAALSRTGEGVKP